MPLRHFLTCLDSDEYQNLGFLMFPHQEHVWIIGCIFNTPCPTCAFSMHWLYIAYCHLLHTPLLPMSCIGLHLVSSSQHVVFTLCFVASCCVLCFEFHFLIHLAPLMHHSPYSFLHLLPNFLLDPFIYSCQKGGEYTLDQYTRKFCHFYITHVHIPRGRNSISHARLQEERYSIGEMHISRGKRHCINKKTLFCLSFLYDYFGV